MITMATKSLHAMNTHQSILDRRSGSRFQLLEYALINTTEGAPQARSVVVDVSLGGLQVRSRNRFQPGSRVTLSIGQLNASPLEMVGEVRYSEPIPETDLFSTGIRILAHEASARIKWGDYVHQIFLDHKEGLE